MRILVLNTFMFTPEKGNMNKVKTLKDTMMYNMCLGFKELGHEVTLAVGEEFRPTEDEAYDLNVLFFKSKFKKVFPPTVLPYSAELKHYIKNNKDKFDMVLSSEVFMFQSLFAARICPGKTVIWQELTAHQKKFHQLPSKFWHNFIAKPFMNHVKVVVPRSDKAREFISRYMKPVSDIVVDHGINIEKFVTEKTKKRQIISSSQLIYRKNVDGIIRKFARFHEMKGYEDIELIIAGRGEEETNLKTLVADLNLERFVHFVGFLSQKELGKYVGDSMAFLVNTRQDLNMVSIPESIVCGTPILTNRQPASAGYIERNRLGIVKDEWTEYDLREIVDSNSLFVNNCIAYRDQLTSTHAAKLLVDIFYNRQKG